LAVGRSAIGFQDDLLKTSSTTARATTTQQVHATLDDESSLTSLLGLPKREASRAVMAMRKTVIFATLFILFFCSRFCCLGNMRDARCAFDLEL
jgi:hypothetical protein